MQLLLRVLQRSGHDVDSKIIEKLTRICHQCQLHRNSPGRFKFTLKDDYEFNYSIVIDVLYIDNRPVLQVIDSATCFGAAKFLKFMIAECAWDSLKCCWIDTYLGPPEYIIHDAGTNFASSEFRQRSKSMGIIVKEVPIEAHNSVGLVERYHQPLKRAYEIISDDMKDMKVSREMVLLMAQKAANDSAGPDGIIPTLLVFGAFPRLTHLDSPAPSVTKRAEVIRRATDEVRKLHAKQQVSDALNMRNCPRTKPIIDPPLNSELVVWLEKEV